jgi:methylmalonyl-CoA/ethylmalonyl-CoA epimerase
VVIDHVGIVVSDLAAGLEQWSTLFGYHQLTEIVENRLQHVHVVFLAKDGSTTVKLVQASDESSPVFAYGKKGGGLHHLCFRCANLESELCRLVANGVRVLARPQPGEAFAEEKIAFVYAGQGLNIELIDTEEKARRL